MIDPNDPAPAEGSIPSHELLPEVYEELRRLATIRLADESQAHTLQATALVHEAWLKLSTTGDRGWQNPTHFFAVAAQAMRRILIDKARRRSRMRHGGSHERVHITLMDSLAEAVPEESVLLIDEGLKELEKAHPRRSQIVVMKFFGGLTNEEVAKSLDTSERSVDREWACAKTWLFRWMSKAQ